ncbi:MAG: 2TM domain-containing protein [Chloroflexia bacterium]|nr:2TM domain-containing protein [Chloroflexia bacterium]
MSDLNTMNEQHAHARQWVRALKGFSVNFTAYVLVNFGLFVIDLVTPGGPWFFWPLLGWGIGIAAHAFSVFVSTGVEESWEERKITELMKRTDAEAEPIRATSLFR